MLADVVEVVVSNDVIMSLARCVTPYPPAGKGAVVQVVYLVVLDSVVGRMSDPDTDRSGLESPELGYQTVADSVVSAYGDLGFFVVANVRLVGAPEFHPPGADVNDATAFDDIVLGASAPLDRVLPDVRNITADQGPTLKRWKARARGRGTRILKRTSHITVSVEEDTALS